MLPAAGGNHVARQQRVGTRRYEPRLLAGFGGMHQSVRVLQGLHINGQPAGSHDRLAAGGQPCGTDALPISRTSASSLGQAGMRADCPAYHAKCRLHELPPLVRCKRFGSSPKSVPRGCGPERCPNPMGFIALRPTAGWGFERRSSEFGSCLCRWPRSEKSPCRGTVFPFVMGCRVPARYTFGRRARDSCPKLYEDIPTGTKAKVLVSGLRHAGVMNEWGYLDVGGCEGPAAEALLELGQDAIPFLMPVLNDARPALLSGSEDATASQLWRIRRKDYAYRYICLLLHRKPIFQPDPSSRDRAIEDLTRDLERRGIPGM